MKAFILTSVSIFLFISSSLAQGIPGPKNSVKVGFGTAYLGSGDYFGKHRFVEYDRSLFKFLSLGLSAGITNASTRDEIGTGFIENTKAWQGDAHLFLAPIHNNINRLRFGGGASFRNTEVSQGEFIPVVKDQSLGYSVVGDYEFYIAKYITIGARAGFQKYENKDQVFYWGLNAGFRF